MPRIVFAILLSLNLQVAYADVYGPPANVSLKACINHDGNEIEENADGKAAFQALVDSIPKDFPIYSASVVITSSIADDMHRDLSRILRLRERLKAAALLVSDISTYQAYNDGRQYESGCPTGTPQVTLFVSRKKLPAAICDRRRGCEVRCQNTICSLER